MDLVNIKSIVLDLDGVYFKPGGLWHFSKWLQKTLEKTEEEVHSLLKSSIFSEETSLGKLTSEESWEKFEDQLEPNSFFNREKAIFEMCADFKKDLQLIELVSSLKEEYSLKLGVCSNLGPGSVQAWKVHGVEPKGFDFKVYSFEVGLRKPDKRIFEIVVEKAECNPQEIIYLDDQKAKLTGAKELGMITHHYQGFLELKTFLENYF